MAQTPKLASRSVLTEDALDAPIIYFDGVPLAGVGQGLGRIALEAIVQDLDENGQPTIRRRIVAHLRGTPASFDFLCGAINSMDSARAPTSDPSEVN